MVLRDSVVVLLSCVLNIHARMDDIISYDYMLSTGYTGRQAASLV